MPSIGILGGRDWSSVLASWYCIIGPYGILVYVVYTFYTPKHTKKPMSKEKIINFRIDAELKNKAKKLADSDGRSLSNWITFLIERELKKDKKKS